jgi:catechol 2,3-dioxygenase-like lactoylglutathione lyase family enzyme
MIDFKRIDHVLICIPEGKKEEARQFYSRVLGLEEIPGEHPRGAIWFTVAGIEIHIQEENGGYSKARHMAFEINDLERAKKHLESNGLELSYSSLIPGRQRFFFRDPFGNRVELLEFDKV